MNDTIQRELGRTLWNIADQLRGAMNAEYWIGKQDAPGAAHQLFPTPGGKS